MTRTDPLLIRKAALEAFLVLLLLIAAFAFPRWSHAGIRSARLPADALPVLLPLKGELEIEQFADRPGVFRWTSDSTQISLPNPGGLGFGTLTLAGGPRGVVPVRVTSGNQTVAFDVQPAPRVYHLLVPPANGERIRVTIQAPTAPIANRDLGVVFAVAGITGGGELPLALVALLGFASLGVYALLRASGMPWLLAGVLVLSAQVLVLVWHAASGWRFAIAGNALGALGAGGFVGAALDRWLPQSPLPATTWPRLGRRDWLWLGLILVLGLCIRVPLLVQPDPVGDLELSARRMEALHTLGLAGSFTNMGDYMPLRLYWLRGFAEIVASAGASFQAPLPPLPMVLIKLPGLLADLALAGLIFVWSRRFHPLLMAAGFTALYVAAPPVWMNVAWWGQVDAILLLPLVVALLVLDRDTGVWSWMCWALALLIKPQAIIVAPVLFVATARLHGARGLLRGGTLAITTLLLGCLPLVLVGQSAGMLQAYVGSVGRFPYLTNSAYNLWYLVSGGRGGADTALLIGGVSLRMVGIVLVGAVTLVVCGALLRRADVVMRVEGAAVVALAFFLLPTQIHERYYFLSLALLVMSAAATPRLLPVVVFALFSATVNILGALPGFSQPLSGAINASPLPMLLSVLNIALLLVMLGHVVWMGFGDVVLPARFAHARVKGDGRVSR